MTNIGSSFCGFCASHMRDNFYQRHQCQNKKDLCDCGRELIVKTSETFYLILAPCSSGLCLPAGPVLQESLWFPLSSKNGLCPCWGPGYEEGEILHPGKNVHVFQLCLWCCVFSINSWNRNSWDVQRQGWWSGSFDALGSVWLCCSTTFMSKEKGKEIKKRLRRIS